MLSDIRKLIRRIRMKFNEQLGIEDWEDFDLEEANKELLKKSYGVEEFNRTSVQELQEIAQFQRMMARPSRQQPTLYSMPSYSYGSATITSVGGVSLTSTTLQAAVDDATIRSGIPDNIYVSPQTWDVLNRNINAPTAYTNDPIGETRPEVDQTTGSLIVIEPEEMALLDDPTQYLRNLAIDTGTGWGYHSGAVTFVDTVSTALDNLTSDLVSIQTSQTDRTPVDAREWTVDEIRNVLNLDRPSTSVVDTVRHTNHNYRIDSRYRLAVPILHPVIRQNQTGVSFNSTSSWTGNFVGSITEVTSHYDLNIEVITNMLARFIDDCPRAMNHIVNLSEGNYYQLLTSLPYSNGNRDNGNNDSFSYYTQWGLLTVNLDDTLNDETIQFREA